MERGCLQWNRYVLSARWDLGFWRTQALRGYHDNCMHDVADVIASAPQVDSTGSVWINSPGNGQLIQIIGAAAPTWPLLADVKPGVMP